MKNFQVNILEREDIHAFRTKATKVETIASLMALKQKKVVELLYYNGNNFKSQTPNHLEKTAQYLRPT